MQDNRRTCDGCPEITKIAATLKDEYNDLKNKMNTMSGDVSHMSETMAIFIETSKNNSKAQTEADKEIALLKQKVDNIDKQAQEAFDAIREEHKATNARNRWVLGIGATILTLIINSAFKLVEAIGHN